jgi:Na+:H+ antiporter, NhaA family
MALAGTFRKFIHYESSAGIILFFAAILALVIDNTAWSPYYQDLLTMHLRVPLGIVVLEKPLLMWINDGFMAVFFLLVGLEVKREMTTGEMSTLHDAILPIVTAIGGMLLPALVYVGLTYNTPHLLRGWAIPTTTDIAFSLGVLALLARHIPSSLKVFLTAMSIFDDVVAIAIIAVFYTSAVTMFMLWGGLACLAVLIALNRFRVQKNWPYIVVGFILWVFVLKSGVHATLAGILLAFLIPVKKRNGEQSDLIERWENRLNPWVAYLILPVFAFANAGIRFSGVGLNSVWSGITLACALGLFIGKQAGITGSAWLAVKMGWAKLPAGVSMKATWGVSLLAGIGFTMSLFIGSLAFASEGVDMMSRVRLGIIMGSFLSGVCGYFCLKMIYKKKARVSI